jgi:hypothetical protein
MKMAYGIFCSLGVKCKGLLHVRESYLSGSMSHGLMVRC